MQDNLKFFLFLSYLSLCSSGCFVLTFILQENIAFWGLQLVPMVAIIGL